MYGFVKFKVRTPSSPPDFCELIVAPKTAILTLHRSGDRNADWS